MMARPGEFADLETAYPPPLVVSDRRPWVRVNFATTTNGVTNIAGVSKAVSGPPDRKVFEFIRRNCDAIMVGLGTARAENYAPPRTNPFTGKAPRLVIVTNSLEIADNASFLDERNPPLIATNSRSFGLSTAKIRQVGGRAKIMAFGDEKVDLEALLNFLRRETVNLLLCEGGSTIFSSLLENALVDELCLTISPKIGSGSPSGIVDIGAMPSIEMTLASFFEVSSYLFCRYLFNPR